MNKNSHSHHLGIHILFHPLKIPFILLQVIEINGNNTFEESAIGENFYKITRAKVKKKATKEGREVLSTNSKLKRQFWNITANSICNNRRAGGTRLQRTLHTVAQIKRPAFFSVLFFLFFPRFSNFFSLSCDYPLWRGRRGCKKRQSSGKSRSLLSTNCLDCSGNTHTHSSKSFSRWLKLPKSAAVKSFSRFSSFFWRCNCRKKNIHEISAEIFFFKA